MQTELAKFRQKWYSSVLASLHEPLIRPTQNKEIYRFTWIGSFHFPAAFRLEHTENNTILSYHTVLRKKGKLNREYSMVFKRKEVTPAEYDQFQQLIRQCNFFQLRTGYGGGADGAQWLLEGAVNQTYRLVDRWNGEEIGEVCRYLISLAGRDLKRKEFY